MLLGGIKRIGAVAEKLVPFMCITYIVVSLLVLFLNLGKIPEALGLIFSHAFSPVAATGGFAGATIMLAMRYGVARGIFSNEAGLGTAGIAQAAGQSKNRGAVGADRHDGHLHRHADRLHHDRARHHGDRRLVSGVSGAALSSSAFETALPGFGGYFLAVGAGGLRLHHHPRLGLLRREVLGVPGRARRVEKPYRVLWTLFVMVGAITHLDFVWLVADTLNAFMAFPNLVSLVLLSPVVVKVTNDYFASRPVGA